MRLNSRRFPPEIVHKRKDEIRGFYDGPLLALVWFDHRFIYFLSTLHTAESSTLVTVKRTSQDGSRNDVPCPPLLPDYQQYMRGVDRGDQLIGGYDVGRHSKKWWKRVFAHILECCMLNAYILEKHAKPRSEGQKEERFSLIPNRASQAANRNISQLKASRKAMFYRE